MRALIAVGAALLAGHATAIAAPAVARLAPADIQKMFFTGEAFTASTPSNIQFKMVFKADGKVTREPVGRSGVRGEGTWKLDKDGFCTTWKHSPANCFVVVATGDNKWSVMKGSAVVAVWSK
jgi:hypothetical protein